MSGITMVLGACFWLMSGAACFAATIYHNEDPNCANSVMDLRYSDSEHIDRIIHYIDYELFKSQVALRLSRIQSSDLDLNGTSEIRPITPGNVRLLGVTKFDMCPDLDIMRVGYSASGNWPMCAFIGLIRSTGMIYILRVQNEEFDYTEFNRMLHENPGITDLCSECLAAIVLALEYGNGTLIVIESYNDVKVIKHQLHSFSQHPGSYFFVDERIVWFYPSRKTRDQNSSSPHLQEAKSIGTWVRDKFKLIGPAVVIASDETTIVELSACHSFRDEISRWQVTFSSSGELLSAKCLDRVGRD